LKRGRAGAGVAGLLAGVALLLGARPAAAHLGSPDVFHEGLAGPYRVFVTVRPAEVVPGVAAVDVRVGGGAEVSEVTLVPTPMIGEGADQAPRPDRARRDPGDPALFTGHLWIMERGSWRVRVGLSGPAGAGEIDVPVAAVPLRIRPMGPGLGALLAALMALLAAALVAIVRAAASEAQQAPGLPQQESRREARVRRVAAAVGGAVAASAMALGLLWWRSEDRDFARQIYRPMAMTASLEGRRLALAMGEPVAPAEPARSGMRRRPNRPRPPRTQDLVPDHGHLVHLFAVRLPGLDTILHLHPERSGARTFVQTVPAAPPGSYRLFADIVHESGFPETLTAQVDLPPGGGPATGDDAVGAGLPAGAESTASLPDGTRLTWLDHAVGQTLPVRTALWFRFRVDDGDGRPAGDLRPYMGMAAHAVFLARDLSVFAHVHPSGSVPMAALAIASPEAMHALHAASGAAVGAEIAFPYGFPKPGSYRIFVQFKRGDVIETAAFDAVGR
jgi:hypothetical protein